MDAVKRWLPVVVWAVVILSASSDLFSPDHTGSFLHDLLGRDLPWALHIGLRKLGHLVAYAILGALAFRAARTDARHPVAVSLAIVILVACIDELHQSTLSSRTGTTWDVLLDVVGGATAIALLVQKWRPR